MRKIITRIVRQLWIETARHRDGSEATDEQRVAIGLRLCYEISSDGGSGARPVIDHYVLSPTLGKLLCHDARDRVRRATRCRAYYEAHRLTWVALSVRCGRSTDQHNEIECGE